MTFAIKRRRPAGFTLIELLVVAGILVLLAGILLPAVSRVYSSAKSSRTKADLLTIATALEAYKSDYLSYPIVTQANSGAAVLGKALLGAYDAAHYYTDTGANTPKAANDTLQNAPPAYDAGRGYSAGDVALMGTAPVFANYTAGTVTTIFVSIKNGNVGHATTDVNWWTPFVPYDGQDGPGSKNRLGAAADANGTPHAAAGSTFGPYVKPESFRINGVDILDAYGSPILYFPINPRAKVTDADTVMPVNGNGGLVGMVGYAPSATTVRPLINADDNLTVFFNENSSPADTALVMLAKVKIVLGDLNLNGRYDAASEASPPSGSFVLWTAGPDMKFGPRGVPNPASFSKNDFYTDASHVAENGVSQAACDDVTNFR